MHENKVIYEPHPVSAERKAELRAQGFRIVDVAFAPEDYVAPEAPANEGGESGETGLSASQLKDELKKRNIEFKGNASRTVLQGLYDAAVAAEGNGSEGSESGEGNA